MLADLLQGPQLPALRGRRFAHQKGFAQKSIVSHWQVRKSADNGGSWTTVDDYGGGNAIGFATDANGNLFVAGDASGSTVRESVGGVGAWTTVDNVTTLGVHAIAADHLGNVFIGGQGSGHWLVRKN